MGPRRTRLKLSLYVTGNSSVLLPLLQQLTDLELGDGSYITVTEVEKDFDHFQFHHEPQPTTATSTRARNFSREKGLLPRKNLKCACDTMDTGAHDVARNEPKYHTFWD